MMASQQVGPSAPCMSVVGGLSVFANPSSAALICSRTAQQRVEARQSGLSAKRISPLLGSAFVYGRMPPPASCVHCLMRVPWCSCMPADLEPRISGGQLGYARPRTQDSSFSLDGGAFDGEGPGLDAAGGSHASVAFRLAFNMQPVDVSQQGSHQTAILRHVV